MSALVTPPPTTWLKKRRLLLLPPFLAGDVAEAAGDGQSAAGRLSKSRQDLPAEAAGLQRLKLFSALSWFCCWFLMSE